MPGMESGADHRPAGFPGQMGSQSAANGTGSSSAGAGHDGTGKACDGGAFRGGSLTASAPWPRPGGRTYQEV